MKKLKREAKRRKRSKEDMAVDAVVWIALILILLITAYPFWYVIVASFSNGYDFMRGGVYFWPRIFTLDNYKNLLGQEIWKKAFVLAEGPAAERHDIVYLGVIPLL